MQARLMRSLPLALQSHMTILNDSASPGGVVAFPLELLEACVADIKAMCAEATSSPHIFLSEPRDSVVEQSRAAALPEAADTHIVAQLPVLLGKTLRKHQLQGISKILSFSGRALVADDMGIGKTLQALGAVSILGAFPLLVICPSAVKVMWAEEIETYLFDQVPFQYIHLIHGSNSALSDAVQPKVVVVSYHMAAVLASSLQSRQWACVVCDESHLMRTSESSTDAQYTTVAVDLCQRAPHCLLLTGTPALASPFDMYNQIDAVRPGLFGDTRWEFALRYARLSLTPYVHVGPCTRPVELASLLRTTCLLRRTKKEVLDLPAKARIIVRVIDQVPAARTEAASFQSRYAHAWRLKRHGIAEAVVHFTGKHARVVLFAHHLALLDELEQLVKKKGLSFIRIDGSVPASARHTLVDAFAQGEVRVAVMGVTACAVGISLASAECAVFCELPPDAAWLAQAEDRLHRLGQRSEVTIYYLLGVHSAFDADHFAHLLRSHQQAHDIVDAQRATRLTFQHALHVHRGDLPRAQMATATATSVPPTPPTSHALQFAVSANTGRIHVRHEASASASATLACPTFYWSASLLRAREAIRDRAVPFWAELDQFLRSLAMHSSQVRRRIEKEALWLPCHFTLKRSRDAAVSGSTVRYTVAPPRCGWGFWWHVRRHFSSAGNQYFATLRRGGAAVRHEGGLTPMCLHCTVRAASLVNVATARTCFSPGAVVVIDSDVAMFCCGACREAFYARRSSGALRRSVLELDRGICHHCHVDCERLCFLLASADNEQTRMQLVEQHHPHLLHFPLLVRRLVQNPVPGNFWHADHVVPVSHGGGEASLENVQTLCVACHAMKTQEDNRSLSQIPTAVNNAAAAAAAPAGASCLSTSRASSQFLIPPHTRSSRVTRYAQ